MSVEQEIVEFQKMEKQLQDLALRKVQFEAQLMEVNNALNELEKSGEKEVYKLTGGILVKVKKEEAIEDLKKKRDFLEKTIHRFGEEERALKDKLSRLGKKLSQLIGKGNA